MLYLFVHLVILIELGLGDYGECIKLSEISIQLLIFDSQIQVQDSSTYLLLQIKVRNDHEIYSVELIRFPFYIALIQRSQNVFFIIVIEDEAIVFMGKAFYIFLQHELDHIEFSTGQSKEIFYFHLDQVWLDSQHTIASHEVGHAFQSFPELRSTYVSAQVDQAIEYQISDFVLFLDQLAIQDLYHIFASIVKFTRSLFHPKGYANIDHIGCDFALSLATDKIALSIKILTLFLRIFLSMKVDFFNFSYQQDISHTISLLTDEVGRLSILIDASKYLIAGQFGY